MKAKLRPAVNRRPKRKQLPRRPRTILKRQADLAHALLLVEDGFRRLRDLCSPVGVVYGLFSDRLLDRLRDIRGVDYEI